MDPKALWSISYGIFIVTSCDGDRANGQIANTVFQVSAEPPRIAVAINKGNYTHDFIEKSRALGVTILDDETPMTLIGKFGFRSGRDIDKFDGVRFEKGDLGCPLVTENAVSVLEAKVFDSVDVGTHTVYVADVVAGKVIGGGAPLTYAQYHAGKGKAPAAAPTYRGDAGKPEYTGVEPAAAPTHRGEKG